jgi:hypothetical protein
MSEVPKPEENGVLIPIVDVDSDNDEFSAATMTDVHLPVQSQQNLPQSSSAPFVSESRSFWKAGDYVVGPSSKPSHSQGLHNFPFKFYFLYFNHSITDFALIAFLGHLDHARVHPKFLHSNATSHKWAFGGVYLLLAQLHACNNKMSKMFWN